MMYIGRNKNRPVWRLLLLTAVMAICLGRPFTARAYIQTQGTVVGDSAVIRKEANANSNAIASILKGDTVTINNEETGADGAVWYKVFVDANTLGYVRGDLIQKEGSSGTATITPTTSTDTQSDTTPTAPDLTNNGGTSGSEVNKDLAVGVNTAVTPIQSQSASVTNDNVRVRAEASANAGIVTKVRQSTAITVNGQANGDDGKVWYRASFIADGSEVSGFIRADFVQLTEEVVVIDDTAPEEAPEEPVETPVEEPVEEPPVNADYQLVYEPDDAGINDWYLYNNIDNKKNKLSEILEAADANGEAVENAEARLKRDKIIIIILAVVVVFLALTVTLLLFKIRDMYYEDFDEDDEDEYDLRRPQNHEPRTVKPVQKERPAARPRPSGSQNRPANSQVRQGGTQNRPANGQPRQGGVQNRPANGQPRQGAAQNRPVNGQPRQGAAQNRPANGQPRQGGAQNRPVNGRQTGPQNRGGSGTVKEAGWKHKNFMMEEDDMEFEFLNWDGEER